MSLFVWCSFRSATPPWPIIYSWWKHCPLQALAWHHPFLVPCTNTMHCLDPQPCSLSHPILLTNMHIMSAFAAISELYYQILHLIAGDCFSCNLNLFYGEESDKMLIVCSPSMCASRRYTIRCVATLAIRRWQFHSSSMYLNCCWCSFETLSQFHWQSRQPFHCVRTRFV